MIWQPFASASVFHEFAGDVRSNYTSLQRRRPRAAPFTYNQRTTTSRVGTYGQYSLGLAGQIVNTGWLGFVRVDYRNGEHIDGWTGNAGIRYQFTPETIAAVMPTKAPKSPIPVIGVTNWTGFYAGGFFGAAAGRTDIAVPGARRRRPTGRGCSDRSAASSSATTISSPTTGFSASKATSAPPTSMAVAAPAPQVGPLPGMTSAFFSLQDKTSWMATATARVGYAWGRTLFYVKGGAAFENSSASPATCSTDGPVAAGLRPHLLHQSGGRGVTNGGFSTSSTRVGWTIGYGSEFDLGNNWSAKAEYDYPFVRPAHRAGQPTAPRPDRQVDISQVKVGVNYRFTPAAVVAKY